MALVNGVSGGGETVPPTGGSGSITLIESTDDSVTVTNGEGPTVDLSVSGGGGSITLIESTDDSVTVTNGEGPTVDLSVSGSSLPAWFQSGDGDPVTTNPTTPNTLGGLYFDTSGHSGLWAAYDVTEGAWAPLGAVAEFLPGINGLTFNADGAGGYSSVLASSSSVEFNDTTLISRDSNTRLVVLNGAIQFQLEGSPTLTIFSHAGSPVGAVTPVEKGDLCTDSDTPALWQATGVSDTDWTQIGGEPVSGVQAFYSGDDISLAANTSTEILSLTIPAGKWTIHGQLLPYVAGATVNDLDVWIGPNSADPTDAYSAASAAVGSLAAGTTVSFALMTILAYVEFDVETTVYLNANANGADVNVTATTYNLSIPNCTGIVATPAV